MSPQVRTYDAASALTVEGGHTEEDPFLAWLARQPVGKPLSPKETERLQMAKSRLAEGAPRRSTEDLLSAARVLHGQ